MRNVRRVADLTTSVTWLVALPSLAVAVMVTSPRVTGADQLMDGSPCGLFNVPAEAVHATVTTSPSGSSTLTVNVLVVEAPPRWR